jgi:hypothetical protein
VNLIGAGEDSQVGISYYTVINHEKIRRAPDGPDSVGLNPQSPTPLSTPPNTSDAILDAVYIFLTTANPSLYINGRHKFPHDFFPFF